MCYFDVIQNFKVYRMHTTICYISQEYVKVFFKLVFHGDSTSFSCPVAYLDHAVQ